MYEQLFRHLLFPAYERFVKRQRTPEFLREYDANQWRSPEELAAIQDRKRERLLTAAYAAVPYFRQRWDSAGLGEKHLGSREAFAELPVIDKRALTENYEAARSTSYDGPLIKKATGGSTGEPFRFEYEPESDARRNAVMWRGYRWAGASLGRRTLFLWGAGSADGGPTPLKERLYHQAFNRRIENSFNMRGDNIGEYVAAINEYRPKALVAYVTPLVEVANWLADNGGLTHSPQSILTGAEPLYENQREQIEAAFGCPVFNTYGCREVMLIASECEERDGLHINCDHLVVETVDSTDRGITGESGDVVLTDLHNFAMPLIRYRNGDRATITTESCACGRSLPLMRSVDGRILDMIRTPDGRRLPGEYFPHLFKDVPGLQAFQVQQDVLGEITIRFVRGGSASAGLEDHIRDVARNGVGDGMRVVVEPVAEIPLTKSGKRRVTVSNLDSVND